MKKIDPQSLVSMNGCEGRALRADIAYARADNLLFAERIYRQDAQLWLHRDLAAIVLEAARRCFKDHGCRLILHDGLRTVEAQEKMLETARVKANPHWLAEPGLLSKPGAGGHPRGMAVDVSLEDENGRILDMGTPFDFLSDDPSPLRNPAHRQHTRLSRAAVTNRNILSNAMMAAAESLKIPLLPLPQEWWDFRLPKEIYELYAPLSDADLPPEMRMMDVN